MAEEAASFLWMREKVSILFVCCPCFRYVLIVDVLQIKTGNVQQIVVLCFNVGLASKHTQSTWP